jgi:hypothetical protein
LLLLGPGLSLLLLLLSSVLWRGWDSWEPQGEKLDEACVGEQLNELEQFEGLTTLLG